MPHKPVQFDRVKQGVFEGPPGNLRLSHALKSLREQGNGAMADELAQDAAKAAPYCPTCERKLEDPVVGILGQRVAFACPHCSGSAILAAWEAEGPA